MPDRTILDLRAAALLNRGTAAEPRLRALLAEALAGRAELPAAIEETRAAMADLPAAAETFGSIAVASLGDADPAAVGSAAYADTVLGAGDLLVGAPARDPARRRVASHLVALGLPAPALAVLAPALVLDDPAARLIAAEAELGLGDAAAARAALTGLEGIRAAVLTARSYMIEGRYPDAVAALKAAGLDTEAAAYAWPSGDWTKVDTADPERAAMAGYMAAQTGAPPAPAAEPATPAAAFRAPLPSLDRPSLRAARELLSSGPGVSGFIGGVIANGDGAAGGSAALTRLDGGAGRCTNRPTTPETPMPLFRATTAVPGASGRPRAQRRARRARAGAARRARSTTTTTARASGTSAGSSTRRPTRLALALLAQAARRARTSRWRGSRIATGWRRSAPS